LPKRVGVLSPLPTVKDVITVLLGLIDSFYRTTAGLRVWVVCNTSDTVQANFPLIRIAISYAYPIGQGV
jgi:hypothetical protein